MARKKKPDEPPSQGWKDTFSDLMNLLLCFFVLLYASANVDEAKFDAIAASFQNTFSIFSAGSTAIGDGVLISNGVSQLNELSKYVNSTGVMADNNVDSEEFDETQNDIQNDIDSVEAAKLEKSEELAEKIQEAIEENHIEDKMEVDFNSNYVLLTLKGAVLFEPGKVELANSIKPTLDKVGMILEKYGTYGLEIEGHTDNIPEKSKKYANNDELSAARALSVFYYLKEHSLIDPASMKHSGRGEYFPIADNSTAEGRAKNRRVEIKIYHELSNY